VLTITPFVESHIAPFTAWFNALPNNHVWTEEFVRSRTTQDPTYDPALMVVAHENGSPVGVLLGSIANETGWIRAFVVREDLRRRGIGMRMIESIEQAFAERGITSINAGWALPRTLLPGIDVTYTSAIIFLDQRGYETKRETRVNMDVSLVGRSFDTADDQVRLRGRGFTTRRARPGDLPSITRLCETHYQLGWATEVDMPLQPTASAGLSTLAPC
jgi:GNAT superfamily N-acetyltransferase